MSAVMLDIVTAIPRHDAIDAVKAAAATAEGWIAAHQFYSNKAATVQVMVERCHLVAFCAKLADSGLVKAGSDAVARLMTLAKDGDTSEVRVTATLTFVSDEPDLRIEIPAVPG
jgi:hypothetical protein